MIRYYERAIALRESMAERKIPFAQTLTGEISREQSWGSSRMLVDSSKIVPSSTSRVASSKGAQKNFVTTERKAGGIKWDPSVSVRKTRSKVTPSKSVSKEVQLRVAQRLSSSGRKATTHRITSHFDEIEVFRMKCAIAKALTRSRSAKEACEGTSLLLSMLLSMFSSFQVASLRS